MGEPVGVVKRRKERCLRVVSFDLGTWFGWFVWELNLATGELRRLDSGVWNLNLGKHQSRGWRSIAAERYVNWLISQHRPEAVAYEAVAAHSGTDAAHLYGAFHDTVMRVCERRGVPFKGFFPGTLKKAVTGHGGATKEQVAEALAAKLGFRATKKRPYYGFKRDDESDAGAAGVACLVDLKCLEPGWACEEGA
jgi:crossover junction endodeoxyribonuclease RuvC